MSYDTGMFSRDWHAIHRHGDHALGFAQIQIIVRLDMDPQSRRSREADGVTFGHRDRRSCGCLTESETERTTSSMYKTINQWNKNIDNYRHYKLEFVLLIRFRFMKLWYLPLIGVTSFICRPSAAK